MTHDMFDEAYWNERYNSQQRLWSGNPNKHLVSETSELAPGMALDVGCGEGGDAVWLAKRGWQVTAVDISTVALERAAEHGAGLPIEWVRADLMTWDPAPARYDLISAQYMHLPQDPREALFRRLAAAIDPGGTLLVVGHHPSDLESRIPRPPYPELFFTADDVAALLDADEWEIVTHAASPHLATDPEGHQVTIHDAVCRARRRR